MYPSEHGYARTSLRAIAQDADVDHALISYYFGSKDGLFAAVNELIFSPPRVLAASQPRHPTGQLARAS